MKENIVFLAGLPRTGSTLLTSILSQNPAVHTASNSALCPLMWEMQDACNRTEQVANRPDIPDKLIGSIPEVFYKDIKSGIIIDKCRTWTLQPNIELIYKYINPNPKIIVMTRPLIEIIKSIIYIRKMNNWDNPEYKLLDDDGEFLMRPLQAVYNSLFLNQEQMLYIQYNDLIKDTEGTLKKVYNFIKQDLYQHNLNSIQNNNLENDEALSLIGLHDIRKSISKRNIDVEVSDELIEKANKYQGILDEQISK